MSKIDKKYIYRLNGQDQYDYCNSCEKPVKQTHLGDGSFGCEHCKSANHIEVRDIETMTKWKDDSIQFPRLIAEISANVVFQPAHWQDLQDSMNITEDELNELFDRANVEWESIKQIHCPINP